MSDKQTCPRRTNQLGPWEYKENLDTWGITGSDRTCSFCGSLHPEDFERVCDLVITDETTRIEQSDKPYKVYINRQGIQHAGQGAIKYYKQHNYTDPADIERMAPKFAEAVRVSRVKFNREREKLVSKT